MDEIYAIGRIEKIGDRVHYMGVKLQKAVGARVDGNGLQYYLVISKHNNEVYIPLEDDGREIPLWGVLDIAKLPEISEVIRKHSSWS